MGANRGDTWTTDALERGDLVAIKQRVLEEPDYIAARDFVNATPLLSAVQFGNLELVKFLLNHDADPNATRGDGYTCLDWVVESENSDSLAIMRLLLDARANTHGGDAEGRTALHLAARRGYVEKAALLIEAGSNVNAQTCDGETPLMEAAECGCPEVVRLLLDHGADAAVRHAIQGQNALELARHAARGADPNVTEVLKNVELNIRLEGVEKLTGQPLDLSAEERTMFDSRLRSIDMAKALEVYRQSADQIARQGDHAGVIRILEERAGKL
jgi:uncharacterized protein